MQRLAYNKSKRRKRITSSGTERKESLRILKIIFDKAFRIHPQLKYFREYIKGSITAHTLTAAKFARK